MLWTYLSTAISIIDLWLISSTTCIQPWSIAQYYNILSEKTNLPVQIHFSLVYKIQINLSPADLGNDTRCFNPPFHHNNFLCHNLLFNGSNRYRSGGSIYWNLVGYCNIECSGWATVNNDWQAVSDCMREHDWQAASESEALASLRIRTAVVMLVERRLVEWTEFKIKCG